ncbi:alpha/beta fold hydrolase [Candidatus Saccharibacteria bacterium]|nr:alpha/beta fold hydrolase [Candidatus Saccharibacteria bacterium]
MKKSDQKPPILLVHGFRGNHLGLAEFQKLLEAEGYQVFNPDIPPAFNTQDETLPIFTVFTKDGYADFIANYILDKHLDHPILIGHSMGSILAAAAAEKYSHLIHDKIFFLSPIATHPPKFILPLIPLMALVPNKFIGYVCTEFLIASAHRPKKRQILDLTYKCSRKITSVRDEISAAFFSMSHSISDFNFKKQAYFIAGSKDRMNPSRKVREIAEKFHAEVNFIPQTGHLINYEVPEKIAELVLPKLKN